MNRADGIDCYQKALRTIKCLLKPEDTFLPFLSVSSLFLHIYPLLSEERFEAETGEVTEITVDMEQEEEKAAAALIFHPAKARYKNLSTIRVARRCFHSLCRNLLLGSLFLKLSSYGDFLHPDNYGDYDKLFIFLRWNIKMIRNFYHKIL